MPFFHSPRARARLFPITPAGRFACCLQAESAFSRLRLGAPQEPQTPRYRAELSVGLSCVWVSARVGQRGVPEGLLRTGSEWRSPRPTVPRLTTRPEAL